MNWGFADIHHHLLYGLDDGARDRAQMYAMLECAAWEGIERIVVTPHVTPGVKRFDRAQYREALYEARAYCRRKRLGISLYQGTEILYTGQTVRFLQENRVPTLAGTAFVLVEFSPDISFDCLREALESLIYGGYVPVLAHTERYRCLVSRPRRAERVHEEMGVLFQVNCATLVNGYGFTANRFVHRMLDRWMIDAVATDAHNTTTRAVCMREAWRALKKRYGAPYARELCDGSFLFERTSSRR